MALECASHMMFHLLIEHNIPDTLCNQATILHANSLLNYVVAMKNLKGDDASQWGNGKFDPLTGLNPLPTITKCCTKI